jgi:hypothetical protein
MFLCKVPLSLSSNKFIHNNSQIVQSIVDFFSEIRGRQEKKGMISLFNSVQGICYSSRRGISRMNIVLAVFYTHSCCFDAFRIYQNLICDYK